MSYAGYLKELLRPLGVYNLEDGTFNAAELDGIGAALDVCMAYLEHLEREMIVSTAQDMGLDQVEALLSLHPATEDTDRRRAALAALLRIGGDSFTLTAINDNLAGCGLNAVASETDQAGVIEIRFPEVPGIPDGFEQMCKIIEEIIPCHLLIEYVFWYITWLLLEAKFSTWAELEAAELTWEGLEKLVL